ncbi:TPA: hypothetical protein IGZ65_003920 [Escherichia coli]|nr:hypothetical protein [Escherichia coli]
MHDYSEYSREEIAEMPHQAEVICFLIEKSNLNENNITEILLMLSILRKLTGKTAAWLYELKEGE